MVRMTLSLPSSEAGRAGAGGLTKKRATFGPHVARRIASRGRLGTSESLQLPVDYAIFHWVRSRLHAGLPRSPRHRRAERVVSVRTVGAFRSSPGSAGRWKSLVALTIAGKTAGHPPKFQANHGEGRAGGLELIVNWGFRPGGGSDDEPHAVMQGSHGPKQVCRTMGKIVTRTGHGGWSQGPRIASRSASPWARELTCGWFRQHRHIRPAGGRSATSAAPGRPGAAP